MSEVLRELVVSLSSDNFARNLRTIHKLPKGADKRVPGASGIRRRIDINRLTGSKSLSFFTGREHAQPEYSEAFISRKYGKTMVG